MGPKRGSRSRERYISTPALRTLGLTLIPALSAIRRASVALEFDCLVGVSVMDIMCSFRALKEVHNQNAPLAKKLMGVFLSCFEPVVKMRYSARQPPAGGYVAAGVTPCVVFCGGFAKAIASAPIQNVKAKMMKAML